MKNTLAYAILNRARISPKKVGIVTDLIRNKDLFSAKSALALDGTKASRLIFKVLKSAESNAKNKSLNLDNLIVSEAWVGAGPVIKSGRPSARSHFSKLIKRTSNIYVGLNERSSK